MAKKERCDRCGRRVGRAGMIRHQGGADCRAKYKTLQERAERVCAKARARLAALGVSSVSSATASPFFKRRLRRTGSYDIRQGRVFYVRLYFVPTWQMKINGLMSDGRIWDALHNALGMDPRDAPSGPYLRVRQLVIERCARAPALRDEIESVHLLGDATALAHLILERVPGIWGAMNKL